MSDCYQCDGCGKLLAEVDTRTRGESHGVRSEADFPYFDWCRSCTAIAWKAVVAAVKERRDGQP